MKKLKSTLPNMFLSLLITCCASGVILAGANLYTLDPIALSKAKALEDAIRNVTPPFDNNPLKDVYQAATVDGDSLLIYPAVKEGQFVGAAVKSTSQKGFSGEIEVIVGFDTEGKLINYSVLKHAETPGLGAKMETWFRTDKKKQNVIGRSLADGELKVSKDGGNVDAITASTISSRAFLDAINRAYSAFKSHETDVVIKKGGNHE
jgi:electron transport complex protein RnfG